VSYLSKLSFSSDPDLVPSCDIKKCADALCKSLSKLFQISLRHSYFPEVWKDSFIIPLHKKGSKSDIKNYRGIAKQSAINKCINQLITAQLQHQCNSAMSPIRHGFIKRRSTSTNLLEFTSVIRSAFKNSNQTDLRFREPSAITEKTYTIRIPNHVD